MECLNRSCQVSKYKKISYKQFYNSEIHYWTWKKSKSEYMKDGKVKTSIKTTKEKKTATSKDMIIEI